MRKILSGLFALLLLVGAPCFATPAVVQVHSTASFGAGTASDSFSSLPTAAHAVIVEVSARTAFNTFTVTVADNQGNTYTQVAAAASPGGSASQTWIFWCPSIGTPSGTFTVTATFTVASGSGTPGGAVVALLEASGLGSTVDQTGTSNGTGVMTATVTASAANTNASDLVVAAASMGTSYNMTTGMSNPATMVGGTATTWFFQDGTSNYGDGVQGSYIIVAATQTSSATWTWTSPADAWSGAIASFEASGGGASCTHTGISSSGGGSKVVPTANSTNVWRQDGNYGHVPCTGSGSSNVYWQIPGGVFGAN